MILKICILTYFLEKSLKYSDVVINHMGEEFYLKEELKHLEQIEKNYASAGLPEKYKKKFLRFMTKTIDSVFLLSDEPWDPFSQDAWEEILNMYRGAADFSELSKLVNERIEKINDDHKGYAIAAERDKWHYEND